jgi:hypothetical protein
VVLDIHECIFVGFTPMDWESGVSVFKFDPSPASFLFTLKNPRNVPARRFALKAEAKNQAISCYS